MSATVEWVKIDGKWTEKSVIEEDETPSHANNMLLQLLAKSASTSIMDGSKPPVPSIEANATDLDNVSVTSEISSSSFHDSSLPSNRSWFDTMENQLLASSVDQELPSPSEYNEGCILERLAKVESNELKLYSSYKKLEVELGETRRTNDILQKQVIELEKDLARLDQYGRRENVEIAGIPNSVNDKALEKEIIKILHNIGMYWIDSYAIVGCHRIGGKDKFGSRNVIVRFLHRKDSQTALKWKKKLVLCKEIGYEHLYMSENLCPAFRSVLKDMNNLKRDGHIGAVWVTNGTIKYKVNDIESVKSEKILHKSDILNLKSYIGILP